MKKIKFVSNRYHLTTDSISKPEPILKNIAEWFRKADRFVVNPHTNEPWVGPDGGKMPTWKACPSIFDIMGTGYVLKTPCDLEVSTDQQGKISITIADPQCQDFVGERFPMPQFEHPKGYYQDHFAWWADWAVEVPEGYSVLYTQPFNRFELPFLTTSGIIDNDKVHLLGTMPFFIVEGFTGTIPAGTPYAQLLPFKREDWESEILIEDPQTMYKKNIENSDKYRVPNGGVYKNQVWSRRSYK